MRVLGRVSISLPWLSTHRSYLRDMAPPEWMSVSKSDAELVHSQQEEKDHEDNDNIRRLSNRATISVKLK